MRDLADFMNDALAERSGSLRDLPTAQVGDRLRRKVRFRRARRHTLEAGGATAVVAVLGTATWFGVNSRHETPQPAVSPTVSTPTPSPAPTTTPAPTPSLMPEVAGLPSMYPLPAGLWDETTAGWVLTIYRPFARGDSNSPPLPLANAVVLVSPAGDRYFVTDLPKEPESTIELIDWRAGDSTALVRVQAAEGTPLATEPRAILDLRTGIATPDRRGLSNTARLLGRAGDQEIWSESDASAPGSVLTVSAAQGDAVRVAGGLPAGAGALLDPAARSVVVEVPPGTTYQVVDVESGSTTTRDVGVDGQVCDVVSWLDESGVLARCSDAAVDSWLPEAHPGLWRLDTTGAAAPSRLQLLGPGDPALMVTSGSWVGSGEVAFGGGAIDPYSCYDGAYTWHDGTSTLLQGPGARQESVFDAAAVGGTVYVTSQTGCSGDSAPDELTSHAPDGTSTLLAPVPAGDVAWGLDTWVVATSGA